MRLESAEIQRFRNFTDAQTMDVEHDVTCLIGKNESGKTTILKALHRLNPANSPDTFALTVEYPRRRLARDRRAERLEDVAPVTATFSLEEADTPLVGRALGVTPPAGTRVLAWRTYGDQLSLDIECDFAEVLNAACEECGVDESDAQALNGCRDQDEVAASVKDLVKSLADDGQTARSKTVAKVPTALKKYAVLVDQALTADQEAALADRLPRFFYFSNYELLPGECDLNELATRAQSNNLRQGDETMLALLTLAGEGPKDFLEEDYDSRKAELQAASAELSEQVFRYWKQNPALSVAFDTDMAVVNNNPQGEPIRHRVLKVELRDARHGVDTNFSTRSSGFQWFFSFLAAFSTYQNTADRVVVLLDEPGTSLHGEAQREFLKYIFEELGAKQQVLYTTHSQHMIDPTRYETMRAVHDQATLDKPELGVVITPVDLSADRDTILPVEAALGYSVAQHLFIGSGPHLAVEGSSDFVFLMRMSEQLASRSRTGLDPRLSIIPVGGAGNMPAFVALMGRRLDVRALIDGAQTSAVAKKVRSAAQAAGVDAQRIIVIGDLPGLPATGDIEDLFTTKDYLWLYNRTKQTSLTESDLPQTTEPILRRIELVEGMFDHAGPAHQLTADMIEFFAQVDVQTLDRFEEIFRLLTTS